MHTRKVTERRRTSYDAFNNNNSFGAEKKKEYSYKAVDT